MRQNIAYDPAAKVFEAFMDFSGGLNTEISNEQLSDNELSVLWNADLSGRGSVKLRTGRRKIATLPAGNVQGMFFYHRLGQPEPDIVLAINGNLYVKEHSSSDVTLVQIMDGENPFTFQTSKPVEAVQYKENLFVATGTKLVELTYDTEWTAKVVVPYTPTVMEAIYIGTNGLAPNPDAYIQDGVSPTNNVEIVGVKPAFRTTAVNEPISMTAYINKPSDYTGTVDYKWEFKKSTDTIFVLEKDFTADYKTHQFNFSSAGKYDIRVTVRKTGDTGTPTGSQIYVLSNYEVTTTDMNKAINPVDGISKCTKILLHWDRIILYGDDTNPYQIYISDILNPRYFPVTNTINFDTGKREPITAIVRFQDMLVVFTKTTIQTLVGKSVETYSRYQIHDGIGCIAGRTAKVVGNHVYFLSHEGVHALKPNPFRLETMNVVRIDSQVKSEMPTDENACAIVSNSMYWLCFPDRKVIYRYYYEMGVWSKDRSSKLDIVQFLPYGEVVYNLAKSGAIYEHDDTVYTDDGESYDLELETKFLDLSASFNLKKLKRLYVLGSAGYNVQLSITVQADSAIVLTPESGHAEVEPDGRVVWVDTTAPNFNIYAGTVFGSWIMGYSPFGQPILSVLKSSVRGKCRRVKFKLVTGNGIPFELFGFGLEFKLKKP